MVTIDIDTIERLETDTRCYFQATWNLLSDIRHEVSLPPGVPIDVEETIELIRLCRRAYHGMMGAVRMAAARESELTAEHFATR
jgi:hypothetical protein